MSKSSKNKYESKKTQFTERIGRVYDCSPDEAEKIFSINRSQSAWTTESLGSKTYDWLSLDNTNDPSNEKYKELSSKGRAYIQNASSWIPVINLESSSQENIIDVCAAPGGKSLLLSKLAVSVISITCNDVSKARVNRMEQLFNNFKEGHIKVISHKAEYLHHILDKESYDSILIDVPCSGEGMVNLEKETSLDQWSVSSIKRLSQQSRKILHSSWQLLRPGGSIVFSTCTVAPEENEILIDKFIKSHADAELLSVEIPPHVPTTNIVREWNGSLIGTDVQEKTKRIRHSEYFEAFYIAKLRKKA